MRFEQRSAASQTVRDAVVVVLGVRRRRSTTPFCGRPRQQQQLDVIRQLCPLSYRAEPQRGPVT